MEGLHFSEEKKKMKWIGVGVRIRGGTGRREGGKEGWETVIGLGKIN